jgi:hypothetical protein
MWMQSASSSGCEGNEPGAGAVDDPSRSLSPGRDVLLQVLDTAGAGDHHRDGRASEQPREPSKSFRQSLTLPHSVGD